LNILKDFNTFFHLKLAALASQIRRAVKIPYCNAGKSCRVSNKSNARFSRNFWGTASQEIPRNTTFQDCGCLHNGKVQLQLLKVAFHVV
jgi:hypothetical protein